MKILTLFALQEETQGLFNDVAVVYTGVGKVNASYSITKEIYQNRPDLIINFGTAGSKVFHYGDIISCNKFIQRDMHATAFGYDDFVTPNDSAPKILESHNNFTCKDKYFDSTGICGTGDSFVTNITGKEQYNVVEMEAYAYAKISNIENIPFLCIKFISDGADGNAPKQWEESLMIGAQKMRKAYNIIIQHLQGR
ncbi:MAG: adenosylhomocysteine nucleosidase [Candidatus Deianiraeaceae bacterium]|jgi:adenosylhomocysteine nucleosidase